VPKIEKHPIPKPRKPNPLGYKHQHRSNSTNRITRTRNVGVGFDLMGGMWWRTKRLTSRSAFASIIIDKCKCVYMLCENDVRHVDTTSWKHERAPRDATTQQGWALVEGVFIIKSAG